jgi:MOSC domain-containing protein YiiM
MGRIVSVNLGEPRQVRWKRRLVTTSIFKRPVEGPTRVTFLTLEGDHQSDQRYHGGEKQAVYVYPSEHYGAWRARLGLDDLPWGSMGENITSQGHLEADVRRNDVFDVGSARLQVTKPREPCFKLNLRFDRDDVLGLFLAAREPGFYCRVLKEGVIRAGDAMERTLSNPQEPTLVEIFDERLRRKAAAEGSESAA